MLTPLDEFEIWFVTGSQHLYGPETLEQVADNSRAIVKALDGSPKVPCRVVFKPVVKTPEEVHGLLSEANGAAKCVGLILWMHTFSPAKMWIAGLTALQKPYVHLHTQFNRDLPWNTIDMDFMNLNQAAHGDREFGFICSRLRQNRAVVVGHWEDAKVHERLDVWMRAACAWSDSRKLKLARFGDNMREVAVTEGDKVAAQRQFGYSVNGYGLGDLAARVDEATDAEVKKLVKEYSELYELKVSDEQMGAVRGQARIELGLRAFLEDHGCLAFTDTFEDLHGLEQLPGLAAQRLMADGYGFGAEGDWKTATVVRALKVMATGLPGGTSFMEDYTYHLDPKGAKVLGAHMLEVCPTIAEDKPTLEVHPLSIGGKADPARLVFTAGTGPGIVAAVIDMGNRFRFVANVIDLVPPDADLPKLPVARALWVPRPNLEVSASAWIYAGSSHHSALSRSLTAEHIQAFADMADVELALIDEETRIRDFRNELRWNEAAYLLGPPT